MINMKRPLHSVIEESNENGDVIEVNRVTRPVPDDIPYSKCRGLGHLTSNNEENEPTDLNQEYPDDEDPDDNDLSMTLF